MTRILTIAQKKFIHAKSLVLGGMFKSAYHTLGSDHSLTVMLLDRYRATRRELPGGYSPTLGQSTRHGASEAYRSTQD
jgi:hypothetical protein